MGSKLTIINDTRSTVIIWVWLSGSRGFTLNGGPLPIKLNSLPAGYKITYSLGKVWFDIDFTWQLDFPYEPFFSEK
jgi:hypothetical protein